MFVFSGVCDLARGRAEGRGTALRSSYGPSYLWEKRRKKEKTKDETRKESYRGKRKEYDHFLRAKELKKEKKEEEECVRVSFCFFERAAT